MSKEQVVRELHKSTRKNFPRRRVIVKGIDDLWQIDLVEMIPHARVNKNFKYLLTVIDVFSKYAWAEPVKSKSAEDVVKAMDSILKKGRKPKNIQSDNGKEFYNNKFKKLMENYDINHYSTFSNLKASVVERFNRTLKNMMYFEFSLRGNYKWIQMLDELIKKYNNKKHRSIGMKPVNVTRKVEKQLLNTVYSHLKIAGPAKFKVGDHVRISKAKSIFEKGYTPNWSTEIFIVKKVEITNPVTYKLEDVTGQPIAGGFYESELQKTKHPDIYLVEKILRKKGKKVYVKWLGLDKQHNSWINKSDIV